MPQRCNKATVGVIAGAALLAGLTAATPGLASASASTARASIAGTTPGWATPSAQAGSVDAHQVRRVQVALSLRDPGGAEQLAHEIATPGSAHYRHPLSAQDFTARYAASSDTVEQVARWLRGQGLTVTGVSANRHFLDVTGAVGQLEPTFGVHLHRYHRRGANGVVRDLVAPDSVVSVPSALRPAISAVLGLDDSENTITPRSQFGAPTSREATAPDARRTRPAAPSQNCARFWGQTNNSAVPQKYSSGDQSNAICGYNYQQVRGMYGLSGSNTGANTTVGIVGTYDSPTIAADTNRAASTYGAPALQADQYTTVRPQGGDAPVPSCDAPSSWASEQALDVQAVHTMAPAAYIVYYGARNCEGLFDALNSAVAANQVSVINDSWLFAGETDVAPAARNQLNAITVQAAVQGQSVLFSSGDSGDNSEGKGKPAATFPASNPWVTAVGGTTVAADANGKQKWATGWESVGNTLTGGTWAPQHDQDGPFAGGAGGGVSSLYSAPDYQKNAIPAASSGGRRAIPDVSALADAYTGMGVGFTNGNQGYIEVPTGGTSLASPLIAGLAADAEQQAHLDRLGFLNPALYGMNASALADVTPHPSGIYTPSMATFGHVTVPQTQGDYLLDNDAKPQTLQSRPGWDPVTGLGTPTAGFIAALGK